MEKRAQKTNKKLYEKNGLKAKKKCYHFRWKKNSNERKTNPVLKKNHPETLCTLISDIKLISSPAQGKASDLLHSCVSRTVNARFFACST